MAKGSADGRSLGARGGWGARLRLAPVLAALVMLDLPAAAGETYRLNAGDTVEISVAGSLDIRQRIAIQGDGYVSVPLIGRVRLEGLTAAEMQTRVETAFASKPIRRTTAEGRERIIVVQPGDVAAVIAEYRPIYVSGSVLKPMQYTFRPMMTAREAITLAGGVSLIGGGMIPIRYDPIELRRDLKTMAIEQVREEIHAARLEAELAGAETIAFEPGPGSPVAERTVEDLMHAATEALKIGLADMAREKGDIARAIARADEQVALLEADVAQESEALKAEIEEREHVGKLASRGTVTSPRLMESRRALQLAAGRKMRARIELARMRQGRAELAARQGKLESERKLAILRELASSKAKLAEIGARVEAAAEKLRMSRGTPGFFAGLGEAQQQPEITIIRTVARQGARRMAADEDFELEPGDTVEVSFRSEAMARLTR